MERVPRGDTSGADRVWAKAGAGRPLLWGGMFGDEAFAVCVEGAVGGGERGGERVRENQDDNDRD